MILNGSNSKIPPLFLIGVDYSNGKKANSQRFIYARSLYDTLKRGGVPAILFNINEPLVDTLADSPTATYFIIDDTFWSESQNFNFYPQAHGLRKALEDANCQYIGSTFEAFCRSSSANKILARAYLQKSVPIPDAQVVDPSQNIKITAQQIT